MDNVNTPTAAQIAIDSYTGAELLERYTSMGDGVDGVTVSQGWVDGDTTLTFEDGSSLVVCGPDAELG